MEPISMEVFPKTVYTDLVGMPDPMQLGLTIHYYNHDDTALYMKVFGSGPSPWSSNSKELGQLRSGAEKYENLDNFLSRTKPSSATTEEITLILRAYSDSGYSQLVHEYSRNVTIVFIKSDDGTWTTDVLNNFDDGTVQGWAVALVSGGTPTTNSLAVATDYVLSPPYSIKHTLAVNYIPFVRPTVKLYKSFTTPNKTKVFAIIDVRRNADVDAIIDENALFEIKYDTTTLIYIVAAVKRKWHRFVVPLPPNQTIEIGIYHRCRESYPTYLAAYLWLDNFKIISK